jgi:glycerol-3-phosphate dehydrogenase
MLFALEPDRQGASCWARENQNRMADFDLAIIGGGINGVGIARDAAGRGLKVLLVEQNDLASGTSSASTKLIHGGLRYLEHGAFRLVREALAEREVLLHIAPHLVRPVRIVLPPQNGPRSALLIRIGLFVYDHLGGRTMLPKSKTLDLTHHAYGVPLQRHYTVGLEFSDCMSDDSRLVVLNAVDAAERGAVIRTRTRCVRVERDEIWTLVLNARGRRNVATARALINAAGPWVGQLAETVLRLDGPLPVRLAQGSHIVIRRLFDHTCGYMFQTADRRVVFALPFEQDFTLIGTTDADFAGDPATPIPSMREITYLCDAANAYFREQIRPVDVIWAFAGIRSLYDDGAEEPDDVTRDYVLALDEGVRVAPLLTVYGGKITTYRRLAEAALAKLAHFFAARPAWTAQAPLPGGDFHPEDLQAMIADVARRWPFLSEHHARRLVSAYGTRIDRIIGAAKSMDDLGIRFGVDLTAAEVRYLMQQEWAETPDDILWRRSKLGLRLSRDDHDALSRFMVSSLGATG